MNGIRLVSPVRRKQHNIRMGILKNQTAVTALSAGFLFSGTQGRGGDQTGKVGFSHTRFSLQKDCMRQTPVSYKIDERLFHFFICVKLVQQLHKAGTELQFFKAAYIRYEDGSAADGNFNRISCVHAYAVGSGGWNHLFSLFGMFADDLDDLIHFFVLSTDDKSGIAGKQETTGGSQFGNGEACFGQRGRYLGAVIVGNDSKNKFHKISSFDWQILTVCRKTLSHFRNMETVEEKIFFFFRIIVPQVSKESYSFFESLYKFNRKLLQKFYSL